MSLIGIAVSCLAAILLPYLDILAAIMGALGNLVAAYALPALFTMVGTLFLTSLVVPAPATGTMGSLMLASVLSGSKTH